MSAASSRWRLPRQASGSASMSGSGRSVSTISARCSTDPMRRCTPPERRKDTSDDLGRYDRVAVDPHLRLPAVSLVQGMDGAAADQALVGSARIYDAVLRDGSPAG